MVAAALALLAAAGGRAETPPERADFGNVMVLLDMSGSMRSRDAGSESRRDQAVRAAKELLGAFETTPFRVSIGLMAFGHRRERDCRDIEVLARQRDTRDDPELIARLQGEVETLRPVGRSKTPIADSLETAANVLDFRQRRATIIIVTDGEETCDRPVCDVAASLRAQGAELTAHVIGFAVASQEFDRGLRCIADKTNGIAINVKDADELIAKIKELGQSIQTKFEESRKVDLTIAIRDAGGHPFDPMRLGAGPRIAIRTAGDGFVTDVETRSSERALGRLPPGRYRIALRGAGATGPEIAAVTAELVPGTRITVPLTVPNGRLTVRVMVGEAVLRAPRGLSIGVGPEDGNAVRQSVAARNPAGFDLAPGPYRVEASAAGEKAQDRTLIEPGGDQVVSLSLSPARTRLRVSVRPPKLDVFEGAEFARPQLGISDDGPSWKPVVAGLGDGDGLVASVRSGRVLIDWSFGDEPGSMEVTVDGDEAQRIVTVKPGFLDLAVEEDPASAKPSVWRLSRMIGTRADGTQDLPTARPSRRLALPPGTYRVELIGDGWTRDNGGLIELKGGETRAVSLEGGPQ